MKNNATPELPNRTMREDIRLYNIALLYAQAGNWPATIARLYQAIDLEANEAAYHSLLAVSYLGCRAMEIPVAQTKPAVHSSSAELCRSMDMPPSLFNANVGDTDNAIYVKLTRLSFYHAFMLDPGDPLLGSYMSWLFGLLDDDNSPPTGNRPRRSPGDNPPGGDRSPRSPNPVTPTTGGNADFINAEAVSRVP
jgi:hypothetical protein